MINDDGEWIYNDEEKKEIAAAIAQRLRELDAEFLEGKRQGFTIEEVAEEVLRRIEDKTIPRLQ